MIGHHSTAFISDVYTKGYRDFDVEKAYAGMKRNREAAIAYEEVFERFPAFKVHAVDTTGAGDIFHGAFIYGLLHNWPLDRIMTFANAAAGLNCTHLGARGGIPPLGEILALVDAGTHHST